jgi:type IV pilus assembly protein PilA
MTPPGPVETSGKAIGALICGLLFLFFPTAVIAIVLGHLSLSDIRKSAGRLKGHGLAVTGLVLGYMGVAFIPFILIIAAIAIPNLLRARMAANEASAIGSLRTIAVAATTYSSTYGNGFPPSLDAMGGLGTDDVSCNHAKLIDGPLTSGQKYGYVFTYTAQLADTKQSPLPVSAATNACTVPGGTGFSVTADPVTRGTTGQRSFFMDESDVIRYSAEGTATADSPPLE